MEPEYAKDGFNSRRKTVGRTTTNNDPTNESVTGWQVVTSENKQLSVKQGDSMGMNHQVQGLMAGDFSPLRTLSGKKFQMFMRDTGDWHMNIDGNMTWLKIYEV